MTEKYEIAMKRTLAALGLAALAACNGSATNARSAIGITVHPRTISVGAGRTMTFTASVTGSTNTGVTWSVQEESECGSVQPDGAYTAPTSPRTCHVVATSQADTSKSDVATVTVVALGTTDGGWTVFGNRVRDTCGNPFQGRGIESRSSTMGSTAASDTRIRLLGTGTNLMRVQWGTGSNAKGVTASDVQYDAFLSWFRANRIGIIWGLAGPPADYAVIQGYPDDQLYWADPATKAKVEEYKDVIYAIDAMIEYTGTASTWKADAISVVRWFRNQGYTVPLMIMGPSSGRNLYEIKRGGADIVAADPLAKTILGWQAYWGPPGTYYANRYPDWTSVIQGIEDAATWDFPVQVGVAAWCVACLADGGPSQMEYQAMVKRLGELGMSWQWWDWASADFGIDPTGSHPEWIANVNATGYGFNTAVRAPICPGGH